MDPTVAFITATTFSIILVAMIVLAVSYKKRLDGSAVCIYVMVTYRRDPSSTQPSGFREHTYRVFAKWTNPYSQRTYYFVKESHQPLDYQESDIVPATINPQHPWFRYLNIKTPWNPKREHDLGSQNTNIARLYVT